MSKNYIIHGDKPLNIMTLHGGPGALGELRKLSIKISEHKGVIEYLQTGDSITLLLSDMNKIIADQTDQAISLIGYSWGAWLAMIYAALYPEKVAKIIIISSAPFRKEDDRLIRKTRLARMTPEKQKLFISGSKELKSKKKIEDIKLKEHIKLIKKVDSYELIADYDEVVEFRYDLYKKIWAEASLMRKNNKLISYLKEVQCPIKVIHGDYDPHPCRKIIEPLEKYDKDYQLYLLKDCGHKPWIEKKAYNEFFCILFKLIS